MKLICSTCNKVFESLIIDKMMAWNECFTRLQKHVSIKHPEVVAGLQMEIIKAMSSVTAYMTLTTMAQVPPEEEYLHLLLEEFQREIMFCAGFDPAEDEDEDEKEDEDDETEKPELPEDEPPKKEGDLELEESDHHSKEVA